MKRLIAVLAAAAGLAAAGPAYAQGSASGSGAVVITAIPGGATVFTQGKDTGETGFGNYGLGGAVEVRVNRFLGVEGEVGGALGVTQDLDVASGTSHVKSPDLLNYSGNLVVSAATGGALRPYLTGGVGGLTLFDEPGLGVNDRATFLTGNIGGGVKWFNGRWGLRADYRFIAVRSKDDAPAFFGQETRYGHRIYGGVLINAGR
jgi:opacity protein-like surface antigen